MSGATIVFGDLIPTLFIDQKNEGVRLVCRTNMPNNSSAQLHYKDDSTFLRFLTMSFVGEVAAIELMRKYGHEFEFDGYGAGSTEMFKDALLKKKRTPDLICSLCGQKLEVRAKSVLKIAMSDSATRPFDKELAPNDWVGFVRVKALSTINGRAVDALNPNSYERPTEIYIVSVAELTRTKHFAVRSKPKSEKQGSETYLEWPTLLSPCTGQVLGVKRADETEIWFRDENGMDFKCIPPIGSFPYNGIRKNDAVVKDATIICGVARTVALDELTCKLA